MSKHKPIVTYEFGTLYIKGQNHLDGDTPLEKSTFDNLWNFILSSKADDDADVVMSVHTRGGRRYIKTGRYVGTVQTKDGQTIEILPKTYRIGGQLEDDQNVCRQVFLNMLRHFADVKARSFQQASLSTRKNFPILEIYIGNYTRAVEKLMIGGIKKNYTRIDGNEKFLKGKLNVGRQITKNTANKAVFAVSYNKYIENIPQNRIIVTTLRKLLGDSHSTVNKAKISILLNILSEIPFSRNIDADLNAATAKNRLFSSYETLMLWSGQFLQSKGFTTFSGKYVNQSLLFQAEKLFEDFVACLFRKYAPTYKVNAQNNRYFLVDKHAGKGMFRLRPDIFVESGKNTSFYECIIIDTKWKAIDATRPDKHYLIDIKDMYQLYAYGRKYSLGQSRETNENIVPKLVLIYPCSRKFSEKLPEFVYEDTKSDFGLELVVVPFDLTASISYERQVHEILYGFEKQPKSIEYSDEEDNFPLAAETPPKYK